MKHQLIEALSGALFTLALIGLEKTLPVPETYRVLLACVIGALGFAVVFTLMWRFRHSKFIRGLQDEIYIFEGDWIEIWHDGTIDRYSIAKIYFDEKINQYILVGNSYDARGNKKAHWTSHNLFYDRVNCRLVYISDGHEIAGKTVFGATCFHIDHHSSTSGDGFFVDDSSGSLQHFDFRFKKLVDPARPWQGEGAKGWISYFHAQQAGSTATHDP